MVLDRPVFPPIAYDIGFRELFNGLSAPAQAVCLTKTCPVYGAIIADNGKFRSVFHRRSKGQFQPRVVQSRRGLHHGHGTYLCPGFRHLIDNEQNQRILLFQDTEKVPLSVDIPCNNGGINVINYPPPVHTGCLSHFHRFSLIHTGFLGPQPMGCIYSNSIHVDQIVATTRKESGIAASMNTPHAN